MMAPARTTTDAPLLDRLPPVRGRLVPDAPLGAQTWFRAGGAAEVLFRPADADDLAAFMAARPADVPVSVIGVGSNLIVRDGGVPGVVVRLARGFNAIAAEADGILAGAACLDLAVAEAAAQAGLCGLEFLSGIPGTIGGAVAMNAGAYGRETREALDWAEIVTPDGRQARLANAELGFAYRRSALPAGAIVTRARLRAMPEDKAAIAARMAEIRRQREASQPTRARTGGSTFKNPEGARAWELIDRAGCRGLRRGDAMVSEKHANFLLNTANATAADIEGLGEEVRRRVKAATGVSLEWEIRRIGRFLPGLEIVPMEAGDAAGGAR
ncbi:MAG: UDP-N-acetylmuramate dehydrogenase [Alphaproteobacteria bacterium]|nr:UDP-N-acetylmuramate dehydrogenase [Alphaproteobacteria bacterium]